MAKGKMKGFDAIIGAGGMEAMSSFMPWLSMFTGGGGDKAKAEAQAAAEKEKKRLEAEAARSRTIAYVALGAVGLAALGTGTYLLVRKK